jgi:ferric-chelate reductase (NADPH)
MPTLVRRASDVAARLLLRPATVTAISEPGNSGTAGVFRTIELGGDRLAGVEWVPGDKLRVRAGGLALRTYTPISWDNEHGRTRFLAYLHGDGLHGDGPGSAWCRTAQVGDPCQLLGPDRSVRLDRIAAPPVFVGDETSFGLLLALCAEHPEVAPVSILCEVTSVDAARAVLADHGVDDLGGLLVRTGDDRHVGSLARMTLEALRAHPDAPLCLSGRAQTIASIRRLLKAEGVAARSTIVKAYWDVNRKGLD